MSVEPIEAALPDRDRCRGIRPSTITWDLQVDVADLRADRLGIEPVARVPRPSTFNSVGFLAKMIGQFSLDQHLEDLLDQTGQQPANASQRDAIIPCLVDQPSGHITEIATRCQHHSWRGHRLDRGLFLLRVAHSRAEPSTFRTRILHIAAQTATRGRKTYLNLDRNWPWTEQIADAYQRIRHALENPQPDSAGPALPDTGHKPDRTPSTHLQRAQKPGPPQTRPSGHSQRHPNPSTDCPDQSRLG